MAARRKIPSVAPRARPAGTWCLQDAKARFSEVVRRARDEGPQRVTVHGRPAVVVVADRPGETGSPARGLSLRDLMFNSPFRDFDLAPRRERLRVRRVRV